MLFNWVQPLFNRYAQRCAKGVTRVRTLFVLIIDNFSTHRLNNHSFMSIFQLTDFSTVILFECTILMFSHAHFVADERTLSLKRVQVQETPTIVGSLSQACLC